MKKILLTLLAASLSLFTYAQEALWITGSAVPGGVQQLTKFPDGRFKFAGTLQKGELRVMTTETETSSTVYLVPSRVDSYVVNNGLPYTQLRDAGAAAWQVTFDEDRYRFTVDTKNKTLKGELFQPWDELFMVGGCLSCGWEGHYFLPFTRVEGEMCTYTWTGEMKERNEFTEPRSFKIMGQNAWDPKSLHPFVHGEDINNATQVCTGGADTKWDFGTAGFYTITVDVFRETISATYIGTTL